MLLRLVAPKIDLADDETPEKFSKSALYEFSDSLLYVTPLCIRYGLPKNSIISLPVHREKRC